MRYLSILLLLPSLVFATNYYRWVDDKGGVHYSERPPVNATSVDEFKSPLKPITRDEEDAKKPEKPSFDAKNCQVAKDNLKILASNNRIHVEEDGEKRQLTKDEIAQKKVEMQKNVEKYCE